MGNIHAYPFLVQDEWREDYLEGTEFRVLRGGAWYDFEDLARCASRANLNPNGRDDDIGFRLVSPI